jgi:thymidylate kinase
MLLVIAGTDGSGKSTVLRMVHERLVRSGRPAHRRDKWDIFDHAAHPACQFLHGPLAELRSCISAMPVPARATFLFWTFHMTMRPELLVGPEWTLVDSYWYKHAASEMIYGAPSSLIRELSAPLPEPDKVYLLDVPPEEAWRRKERAGLVDVVPYECGMAPLLDRDSFVAHQSKLRAHLGEWARRSAWVVLDASRPPEQSAEDIVASLLPHSSEFVSRS